MLEIEVLKGGVEIIPALSAEWAGLCQEGGGTTPFLRPEWFTALVTNFKKDVELFTARKNGKLRALLPLMRKRSRIHGLPVRKLQAVFNPNTPQYDLIHGAKTGERPEIVDAIWKMLESSKGWDVFECRLVRADSWLSELVRTAHARGFPTGVWPMDTAPFVEVPAIQADGSISSFFSGKRKHLGKELARRFKRLEEKGAVDFVVSREYCPEMIERYLELESKGWKGQGGTAAIFDERSAGLLKEFANSMAANGDLLVYELRLESVTIAMSLNIRSGGRVFHWKTTYDEEFSRYSPGNLLFRHLLTECSANGVGEIDFLCPSLPYKTAWATGERDHVAFYIFRPAFIGRMSWIWKFRIISRLRKLKKAYPRLVATLSFWPV